MGRHRSLAWILQRIVGPLVLVSSLIIHKHLGLEWADALYESVRIFLLDANTDVGKELLMRPWAYAGLWIVRCLAPIVTAATFIEVLLHFGIFGIVPFYWSRHVIVCGAGRIGSQFVRSALSNGNKVAIIDNDPDNPHLETLRRAGAKVVIGDASDDATLATARIDRASHLIAATANDVLNLNISALATTRGAPRLKCICHVYNLRLKEDLSQTLRESAITTFNVYQLAAEASAGEISISEGGLVVIAGFGRFGRSLLSSLASTHGGRIRYRVIDPNIDPAFAKRSFLKELTGQETLDLEFIQECMMDADVWETGLGVQDANTQKAVAVVCTDNDMGNLVCGLELRNHPAVSAVHIRLFKPVALLQRPELQVVRSDAVPLQQILVWEKMLVGFKSESDELAGIGRMLA